MKSEIAWLMEAFLEEDPKKVRIMIKNRMADVTECLTATPPVGRPFYQAPMQQPSLDQSQQAPQAVATQSPSMQRIMAQNPDLIPLTPPPVTAAAAQALAARQAAIDGATSGRQEKGRTSARKM